MYEAVWCQLPRRGRQVPIPERVDQAGLAQVQRCAHARASEATGTRAHAGMDSVLPTRVQDQGGV